jgi:hypothetical protein
MSALGTAGKPLLWVLRRAGNSRRRLQLALLVGGALACALGLLSYGLAAPEIPFFETPVTYVGELRADTMAKVFGRIDCTCTTAIDREESDVGFNGHTWNATYKPFSVNDPSGSLLIDTTSVTRMTYGPSNGDWLRTDWVAIYGSVYDQGTGSLLLRAQMIAKAPDDTPARFVFVALAMATVGGVALAFVLTDRLVFGRPEA